MQPKPLNIVEPTRQDVAECVLVAETRLERTIASSILFSLCCSILDVYHVLICGVRVRANNKSSSASTSESEYLQQR